MKILRVLFYAVFGAMVADLFVHLWFVFYAAPRWGVLSERSLAVEAWLFPSIYILFVALLGLRVVAFRR